MSNWRTIPIGKAIQFNPPESIKKGAIAKKIAMGKLTEFQRKINGFEISEYSAGPKFRNGDTLVAKITPCIENGKTAFVDILNDGEIAFGSSEFIVLRNTSLTDPKFIFYLAISPTFRFRAISCMEGTSGRQRVNENTLRNFELAFPSLLYQQKIAKVLSDLDAKIELNNKINAELEAMAKLIYDYWFVQFNFPISKEQAEAMGKPELEGRGYKSSGGKMVWNEELRREVPEGWEVKAISELIEVKDGTHDSPKSVENGHRLITSKHLRPEGLDFENANFISKDDFENINKRSKVDTGDILFSMIGNIGTIYKVDEAEINFAIKNVALYKTSDKLKYKNYLFMFLGSSDMNRYMANVISGSIQKFIGLGSLRKMPLLLDESTIVKFDNATKPIFKKFTSVKRENQKLAELRDWLLPMLMNGQVVSTSSINSGEPGSTTARGLKTETRSIQKIEQEEFSMVAEPRAEYRTGK